jgi:hypothetical protein
MMKTDTLALQGGDPESTRIYLEKDIFFNSRLGQLRSVTASVDLNFRESILLRLLVEGRVRKQKVIDAAWGDNGTIVTEASYHQLVRSLRKKFAEIGLPAHSIKTLPRFGLEYLREHPPEGRVADAIDIAPAESVIASRCLPPKAIGGNWTKRLFLLLVPFLVGLFLGHLFGPAATIIALHVPSA